MNFNFKDMYRYLISHTFPGMLLLIEVSAYLQSSAYPKFFDLLQNKTVVLIVAGYAFSTLLGTILDGIQHFIFDFVIDSKLSWRKWVKNREDNKKHAKRKYMAFKSNQDKLDLYDRFIDGDIWYPYEAYANTALAMFLGLIMLCHKLSLGMPFWIAYFIVIVLLGIEAVTSYKLFCDEEEKFIEVFSPKDI